MTAIRLPGARGRSVRLTVNGSPVDGFENEALAATLMAADHVHLRNSPRDAAPRGAFCLMGVCQECMVRVDGVMRQSCLVLVQDGMAVEL